MFGGSFTGSQTALRHLSNHLQAAGEGKSGMLMGVHPVGFLEDWVFGDFQSLKLNPDEHRIQPIEASHLAHSDVMACDCRQSPEDRAPRRPDRQAKLYSGR
ncbi:hypothetical protein [Pulveribacter sp.]|uniref:hypothetical protein n=1 Tax=Pulveribacter sp. TaxID=2678893 RepID=UPI0028A0C0C4|nr:hypothetical protein [Pulveribacter sp.]